MNEVNNIPEGWVETTLEEVVESANTGLDAIKRAPIVEEETGLKCFRIQDASQKKEFTNWGNTLVENKNYNKFKLIEGDILIARTGNTIGVHYLVKQNLKSVFNNGLIRLRANRKIDYKFLYKIIESGSFERFIQSIAYGTSTQPNMQINVLLSFKISLPPLPEQKSIAAILTSFDDKIELLQAQNKTLEELAQTLFKEWFGKYKVGDELPEGWRVGIIEDLTLKINSGGTPSTKEESYYNGYINWFSTKELQDNFIFESDKKITEEGLNNSSTKLFPKDTVIMAIYAAPTVGRLGILNQESAFNQAAVGLIAKNKVGYPFVFLLLKYFRDEFNNLSNGAAQQNLNVGIVKNFKICIPNEESLNFFNKIQMPLFEKIRANSIQIQTLTKTRDELLPKLMSGEIRVKM